MSSSPSPVEVQDTTPKPKRGRPRHGDRPSTSREYHKEYMKRYYEGMGKDEKKIRSAQQNHRVDRETAEKIAALDYGYGRNAKIKALVEEYRARTTRPSE